MVINSIENIITNLQFKSICKIISNKIGALEVFSRDNVPPYLLHTTVSVINEDGVTVQKCIVTEVSQRSMTLRTSTLVSCSTVQIVTTSPKYYAGSILDLKKQLKIDDKVTNRYPFIALIWDKNNRITASNDITDVQLRFIIGIVTEQKFTQPERSSNFSMLYKLESELQSAIRAGGWGVLQHYYEFTNYDEPLLGNNNILNDYVDAVIIETRIKYLNNYCIN